MVWPWERKALATWETNEECPDIFSRTWTVHFPTMRMTGALYWLCDGHDDEDNTPTEHLLRRTDAGWQWKLTEESRQREINKERHAVATALMKSEYEERLRELEEGNKWGAIPDAEFFAGLEPVPALRPSGLRGTTWSARGCRGSGSRAGRLRLPPVHTILAAHDLTKAVLAHGLDDR